MRNDRIWRRGVVVWHPGAVLSPLYNFIQLGLNSGSAQVQTLLAACQRFTMVRISDMVPVGNKAKRLSSVNHTIKTINQFTHMAKIAQRSVRKHIRDNCFEDVLIEMKKFGIKVEKRVFYRTFSSKQYIHFNGRHFG